MSGMNLAYIHSHTLHDIDTIFEREHDTLLGRTNNMITCMQIKIDSIDGTSRFPVLQHTLCAVAKRQNTDTS